MKTILIKTVLFNNNEPNMASAAYTGHRRTVRNMPGNGLPVVN